jgi:hypothetical protein
MDNREVRGFKSNPMIDRSSVAGCAKNAALVAAIITVGCLIGVVLRGVGKRTPLPAGHVWFSLFGFAGLVFSAAFALFFVWNVISAARAQPVRDILEDETPESELLSQPLYGFVAMEFYWLILNRTLMVFAAPSGLYGWKTNGPVSNGNRKYFEPYQEMLEDTEFTRDLPAIRKLADLPGGFIYPSSEIASITSDDRNQWGMGGIPHSGHVHVRLVSGMTRKLIVLGEVISDEVRDRIIARLGTGITSMV